MSMFEVIVTRNGRDLAVKVRAADVVEAFEKAENHLRGKKQYGYEAVKAKRIGSVQ